MTEEKLKTRLAQVFTEDELMCLDVYFSRRHGLCLDVYLEYAPRKRFRRFIKNVKNVAMGKANIRFLGRSVPVAREETTSTWAA